MENMNISPASAAQKRAHGPAAETGASAVALPRGAEDLGDAELLASVLRQVGPTQTPPRSTGAARPSAAISWTLPGFERRCRVSTIFGELPIHALRRRDKVRTRSGAFRDVQWIDEIRLDADFLARHPEGYPVQLRCSVLAPGLPARNMLVSPAQVVCTDGLIGAHKTGPAAEFQSHPGIFRAPQAEITYFRFHCGEPVIVCIDGAWFSVAP